jgi:hypothetical protein
VPYYVVFIAAHAWLRRFSDVWFGVVLVLPLWALSIILVGDAGAAAWSSGAYGEEWTSSALRRALGREYVVVNDFQVEKGNIDHIVIGPGGVFVVETKWSSTPWASVRGSGRLRQACKQARQAARVLERRIADEGIATRVHPLVVVWGGRTGKWAVDSHVRTVEKVAVVAGIGLQRWASGLADVGIGQTHRDDLLAWLRKS